MDHESLKALQVIALKAVEDPTYQDFYDRICRWYSKTFSTPLAEVRQLADTEVLSTYFKETYYELAMDDSDDSLKKYQELRDSVLNVYDGTEIQKELQDDDWAAQVAEELEAEHAKEVALESATNAPVESVNDLNLLDKEGQVTFNDLIPED